MHLAVLISTSPLFSAAVFFSFLISLSFFFFLILATRNCLPTQLKERRKRGRKENVACVTVTVVPLDVNNSRYNNNEREEEKKRTWVCGADTLLSHVLGMNVEPEYEQSTFF